MAKACSRCGSRETLESDHIVPKAEGGKDARKNRRWLCKGCHDYRHTRDGILEEIDKRFTQVEAGYGNQAQLTMWVFRLGVLEWLNTPELVRGRGYTSYGIITETHYSRWYEAIKIMRAPRNPYKEIAVPPGHQAKLLDLGDGER